MYTLMVLLVQLCFFMNETCCLASSQFQQKRNWKPHSDLQTNLSPWENEAKINIPASSNLVKYQPQIRSFSRCRSSAPLQFALVFHSMLNFTSSWECLTNNLSRFCGVLQFKLGILPVVLFCAWRSILKDFLEKFVCNISILIYPKTLGIPFQSLSPEINNADLICALKISRTTRSWKGKKLIPSPKKKKGSQRGEDCNPITGI